MENQCSQNQCSSQPQCQSNSQCQSQPSCQPQCPSMCDCPACRLVCLAKEAKMNVLTRKMEAVIEKEYGAKLDKEAQILVKHFMAKMKLKHEKREAMGAEMEKFHEEMMANWKA
ncbi:MAG: hypothetical protein KGH63_01850 [Candidatus Micrarchaeota archaeon]|nr:hypothetical protein [Candidatus Micrarchaeota archaeon]